MDAKLGRWERVGAKRMAELLQDNADKETMHLWYLCENADSAARAAGMKRPELFDSIYSYQKLLPEGTRCGQVGTTGNSMYSVFNPYFKGQRTVGTVRVVPGAFDIGVDTPEAMRL